MSTHADRPNPHPAVPLRRIAREIALQYLYQLDMGKTAGQSPLDSQFWEQMQEERPALKSKEWKKVKPQVQLLLDGVRDHGSDIDRILASCAENWSLDRMALVDRNLLRLATFELVFRPDVPAPVCINEAIEIAKTFGGDESSRFINGILDRIRRNHVEA